VHVEAQGLVERLVHGLEETNCKRLYNTPWDLQAKEVVDTVPNCTTHFETLNDV